MLYVKEVLKSDKDVMHHTGFPSEKMLRAVFDWLEPSAKFIRLWKGKNTAKTDELHERLRVRLSLFDEFLLTFIRLHRGHDIKH